MASADGSGIGAGFGGVDEDLEGLLGAIFIDGDEGFAERGFNGIGPTEQGARAGFLGLLPDLDLLAGMASSAPDLRAAVSWVSSTTSSREPVT